MKKNKMYILYCLIIVVALLVLTNYNQVIKAENSKKITCTKILDESTGFSTYDSKDTAPPAPSKDIYLFDDNTKWNEFEKIHFPQKELPEFDFAKEKVLVIQLKFPRPTQGPRYSIQNIDIDENAVLSVSVKQRGWSIVEPLYKDLWFSNIIICKINNNSLPNNLEPYLQIVEK